MTNSLRIVVIAVLLLDTSCATASQKSRQVSQAVHLCKELLGPDADRAEGEVRFWMQAERAEASRKLWNERGVRAIDERLAAEPNEIDRGCLGQLRKEAINRELERE